MADTVTSGFKPTCKLRQPRIDPRIRQQLEELPIHLVR